MNKIKKNKRNIEYLLIKKASQSKCTFRISAIGLNKKNQIVLKSTNRSRYLRKYGGFHAEKFIMRKAKKFNIKTIIITRTNINNKILKIDACEKCKKIADKLGITIISL